MNNQKQVIHPSTLGAVCERFLWHYYRKSKTETLKSPEALDGKELEKVIYKAIKNGNASYIFDGREIELPKKLQDKNAALEFPIKYELEGFSVSGRADFLRPGNIIDIKQRYSTEIVSSDKWQTMGYVYPYLNGEDVTDTYIYFGRYGILKLVETYDIFSQERIRTKLLSEFNRIKKICDNEKESKGIGNWQCYYCPFAITCPSLPQTIKELSDDPFAVGKELIKLDAKLDALKKLVKPFVSKNGNIKLENGEIGYFTGETSEIDNEGLLQYIKDKKLKILDYFTSNKTRIKSLCKNLDWLTSFVTIIESNPRFDIKTEKPKDKE